METFLLTRASGPHGSLIAPRRLTLTLTPGSGRLTRDPSLVVDDVWWQSMRMAWASACLLTDRSDCDARLDVQGTTRLTGGSAGLPFGVLALDALLGPPKSRVHFATGAVTAPSGMLAGGAATREKAAAASVYAPQLGMRDAVFLSPPVEAPEDDTGVRIYLATDVGSAYARVAPAEYRGIASQHRKLREVTDPAVLDSVDVRKPFAIVEGGAGWAGADVIGGIPVIRRAGPTQGARITVGDKGMVLWRAHVVDASRIEREIPRVMALAREAART